MNQSRVAHSDFKPMNILLIKNKKTKLSDFGLNSSLKVILVNMIRLHINIRNI
jgi:serine/threonine protein kinase